METAPVLDFQVVPIKTVGHYCTSIFSKLSVPTRARAIVRAREAGFGGEIAPPHH